jgi:YrbI family 3-deoxy-D-manno-octulosonate 8-phosphate phosphatase
VYSFIVPITGVCAIIPCRGGSKGIPRKNLMPVGGVKLVARAIRTAQSAGVDEVFVSTDDQEIASVALSEGAMVIVRPKQLGSDKASTDDVLLHAIQEISGYSAKSSEKIVVLMQATSPFTSVGTVRTAIRQVQLSDQSVISVTPWHGFLWNLDGILKARHHDPRNRLRRQDLGETMYLETGGVYAARLRDFMENKNRFGKQPAPVEVSRMESLEIDTWDDLSICNSLAEYPIRRIPKKIKLVVTDFDGVLTDNLVNVHKTGESSLVSRFDGEAVSKIRKLGTEVCILTSEQGKSPAWFRAKKLGMRIYSSGTKGDCLYTIANDFGLTMKEITYVGNSELDVEAMRTSSYSFAPADAHFEALRSADQILPLAGGQGVLLKIAEIISRSSQCDY